MIKGMPARRAGTPDEIGDLAEFLLSSRGRFISGADFLADGGCTASYWYGDLQYLKATHCGLFPGPVFGRCHPG